MPIGGCASDIRSQEELLSLTTPHWITSVAFNPTGDLLGAGCVDDTARLYRYRRSRDATLELSHQKIVDTVDFAQINAEPIVATGSHDYTVELWNIEGERQMDALFHGSRVLRIRFDPLDPTILHTFTTKGIVRRWDLNTGLTIGPAQSFTNQGKDFCVGKGWVAGIGDGDRTLYVRSRANSKMVSRAEMPRLTGWRISEIGQRRLTYDEWITLFEDDWEYKGEHNESTKTP